MRAARPLSAASAKSSRASIHGGRERLLRIDVLSGEKRLPRDLVMALDAGEVRDDVDVRVGEELLVAVVGLDAVGAGDESRRVRRRCLRRL